MDTQRWQHNLLLAAMLGVSLPAPVFAQTQQTTSLNIINQAAYSYNFDDTQSISGFTTQNSLNIAGLIDPLGQVTGCAGEILSDYTGFSVALYEVEPNDPTKTEVRNLVSLTRTELPDIPGNGIAKGLAPNIENSNPFFLTNGEQGNYNFLLDPNRGQLDIGRTYVLIVNPPPNTIYNQRRVKITIQERRGDVVVYQATSLDGKPLSSTDDRTTLVNTINIRDAERVGLVLGTLNIKTNICQAQDLQIIKTGDRATATPGDTVIYRLSVKNLASSSINNVVIADTLPLGFNFVPASVQAEFNGNSVQINATQKNAQVTFQALNITLPPAGILNVAYAAVLTPAAIRGTGENSAIATAQRTDNNISVKDGPAIHRLRLLPGILSDCGTLIGRVFVDKNFDGEQQPNEPGVPNAVIFLDDGNRVITDKQGLFSVANVLPGYRTGVLDFTSVPGYRLAPNRKFKERNSQSRLVRLAPGGLARMNFAVIPLAEEGSHD
ncbi:DUF11 domain-containing protein [Chroococcidiopsis sp. TS-821]|uniref:DUF11 domain-containing protein n=1 Tax=Chroococcidiopsis sp. TS-821 TaxID=1378066 RepID=UPI001AEF4786|nr:DUF11 domain-containing protein [Chroococcidiopsis sp. TS-821]